MKLYFNLSSPLQSALILDLNYGCAHLISSNMGTIYIFLIYSPWPLSIAIHNRNLVLLLLLLLIYEWISDFAPDDRISEIMLPIGD